MSDEHDHYREWSAAYVLAALDPAERMEYEAHLLGCSDCQAEVARFAALPGLLAQVGPTGDGDDDEASDRVTELALIGAGEELARLKRSTRRWQGLAAALVAALLVVAGIGAFSRLDDDGVTVDQRPAPVEVELAFQAEASGSVTISKRGWGTNIEVDLDGLPQRDLYQLWTIDAGGGWTAAATWRPTLTGRALLTGAAAVPTEDVIRVLITSEQRDDVLVDATP